MNTENVRHPSHAFPGMDLFALHAWEASSFEQATCFKVIKTCQCLLPLMKKCPLH